MLKPYKNQIITKTPRELFTSRGCCRCKAQGMMSWSFTTNALVRSRCSEIDSPER